MGVFQRIKDMTKASIHEVLDKVEDPVVMLNQYIRDMEEEIAQAEVTVARQIAGERKTKERLEEVRKNSADREARAAVALKDGQEMTARQLLEEKLYFDQRTIELADLYDKSKEQAETLLRQLHEMKDEYYKMRSKRNELAARSDMAKAKKQMAQASGTSVIESGRAARGFGRMEEKIMQQEAEADVVRGAVNLSGYGSQAGIYNTADAMKREQVEASLQQLREKIGMKPAAEAGEQA